MDRKLTIRLVFSAVMLLAASLVSCGCGSADFGQMGVSGLMDPVPPQWEPEVETLAPLDLPPETEEASSVE